MDTFWCPTRTMRTCCRQSPTSTHHALLIPGDRGQLVRVSHTRPPARRLLDDPGLVKHFEGGLGATCLLNPQLCLHAASVPREGAHRDIVQFNLAPSDRALSPAWASELPPDPDI